MDLFKYFGVRKSAEERFGPKHIEWLDDTCCNIVFKDSIAAMNAMYRVSYDPSKVQPPTELIGVNSVQLLGERNENCWCVGVPYVGNESFILRLARESDVKIQQRAKNKQDLPYRKIAEGRQKKTRKNRRRKKRNFQNQNNPAKRKRLKSGKGFKK